MPDPTAQPLRTFLLPIAAVAHVAALPLKAVARTRAPAVIDPTTLHPGDVPPTAGRLLLLFDGGCGICLHARDVFAVLDRRDHLAFDRIARHDRGLLSAMDEDERYGSWHVIHPDGHVESGGAGLVTVIGELPGGGPVAKVLRRGSGLVDSFYEWFVHNRAWISQGTGLIEHPQRDPREQPGEPGHDEVVGSDPRSITR